MFKQSKEKIELLKYIESTHKNTELMLESFMQMIGNNQSIKIKEQISGLSEEEKMRAVYALNLCTVSVSQIIDYDDVNILEQEYEAILNNLNLENMPKDEPLLNVLKQIMDTVSFFRIQERDKEIIEKKYQQKMKDAIWSAVPNLGLIVAGGNPWTMAISLATQFGIGYMNYRKNKASNELELEEVEWKLQRAAIEQLHGLRRELFDASWRLAERYGFDDRLRLTEKQIYQYNKILMDGDDIRRYERLDAIKDCFGAYPAFWYHFGHAANCIAQTARKNDKNDIFEKFCKVACDNFEKFLEIDSSPLLRENPIASSCALEYIDLLDVRKDREKIKELLDKAIRLSGRDCDVLQICAMYYLKISEEAAAINLFKYLVNEDYNTMVNAQLLSTIYVYEFNNGKKDFKTEYELLERKVPEGLKKNLFPFPDNNEDIVILEDKFIEQQRKLLLQQYEYAIERYFKKYEVIFNKIIPVPNEDEQYPDIFFTDSSVERSQKYKQLFANKNKTKYFLDRLIISDWAFSFLNVLNEMTQGLQLFVTKNNEKIIGPAITKFVYNVQEIFSEKRNEINDLQKIIINENFGNDEGKKLLKLSFNFFTKEAREQFETDISNYASQIKEMNEISEEEGIIKEFCLRQGIPEFKIKNISVNEYANQFTYFPGDLLGKCVSEQQKRNELMRKMVYKFEEKKWCILKDEKRETFLNIKPLNNSGENFFDSFFVRRDLKKINYNGIPIETIAFALLEDAQKRKYTDLIFTTEGIFLDINGKIYHAEYNSIEYDEQNRQLNFSKYEYKKKDIYMDGLYEIIQSFSEMTANKNSEH